MIDKETKNWFIKALNDYKTDGAKEAFNSAAKVKIFILKKLNIEEEKLKLK